MWGRRGTRSRTRLPVFLFVRTLSSEYWNLYDPEYKYNFTKHYNPQTVEFRCNMRKE